VLSILNRIKVRGVKGPISGPNSIFLEPFFNFGSSIDWGVVLYKYKIIIIIF
jgi:hypothetical protein